MTSPDVEDLLARARQGDGQALGELLDRYRPYLRLLALRRLQGPMRARIDASDVVQSTFFDVQRDLPNFRGQVEGEWLAWLRAILEHNVAQAIERHIQAQKRAVDKEQRLDDGSGSHLGAGEMPGNGSSPSQRAMRGEEAVRLASALAELSDAQRDAVRLRHLEGWPLARIAEELGRTEVAVAGLVKRGLRNLRRLLADESRHE